MTSKIEPKRSHEYRTLLQELRNSFVSAAEMVVKLYQQGKKDGLSNEDIRDDIEIALDGVVTERRLREILPVELKRQYTHALTVDDSALSAESEEMPLSIEELDAYLKAEIGLDLSDMPHSTYDEIMDKAHATVDGISAKLIPEMCEALHRERPSLKETGLKNIIAHELLDIYPGIVNDKYLLTWKIIPKQLIKRSKK